jgi:hypothetical protein
MQTLFSITPEEFQSKLYNISDKNLMSLLYEIYELKNTQGKKWNMDIICDIERKETKINAELMKRGYLDKKDYADYFKMLNKINYKKKVF